VEKVFLSSTFFPNSLAQVAEREKVLNSIAKEGKNFAIQVKDSIIDNKIPCTFSGAPWMPYITFDPDSKYLYRKLREEFYRQLIRQKVFLQPFHHGYIAYRHTKEDLDYAARAVDKALKSCRKLI
jgi:glutamate-1-semialdehyde aminotransferase